MTLWRSFSRDHTEAYVDLIGWHLSGRLSLSPAYFRRDRPTLYVKMEGHIDIGRDGSLFAHGGLPAPLGASAGDYWCVGARQRFGQIDLAAA